MDTLLAGHKLDVDDLYRLADAGILGEDGPEPPPPSTEALTPI